MNKRLKTQKLNMWIIEWQISLTCYSASSIVSIKVAILSEKWRTAVVHVYIVQCQTKPQNKPRSRARHIYKITGHLCCCLGGNAFIPATPFHKAVRISCIEKFSSSFFKYIFIGTHPRKSRVMIPSIYITMIIQKNWQMNSHFSYPYWIRD